MKVHPDQPPPDMLSMKGGLKRYEQQHQQETQGAILHRRQSIPERRLHGMVESDTEKQQDAGTRTFCRSEQHR